MSVYVRNMTSFKFQGMVKNINQSFEDVPAQFPHSWLLF